MFTGSRKPIEQAHPPDKRIGRILVFAQHPYEMLPYTTIEHSSLSSAGASDRLADGDRSLQTKRPRRWFPGAGHALQLSGSA